MEATEFPKCCGLEILTDFGNTDTALNKTAYTDKEVENFLKTRPYLTTIVALNSDQYNKLKKVFWKNGYKQISKFHHTGHGKNIHLMLKIKHEFKK